MSDDSSSYRTMLQAHLDSLRETLHDAEKSLQQDSLVPESIASALTRVLSNLHRDFPSEQVVESSTADLLTGFLERTQKRRIAAPTGFSMLDDALNGGFQAKRLVVLLGAPGSGKTSLANQIAETVAQARPVMYVTSEDTPDVLLAKTLSRTANLPYSAVLHGWDDHRIAIYDAIEQARQRPSARLLRYLDVTSGAISLSELSDRTGAFFEGEPGPGLIVIDYLQRMARATRGLAGIKELREAVTYLTEQLRALAIELSCTVLAVASMNRASGYGKNGESSALAAGKESGDIEYSADVIMALAEDSNNKRSTAMFAKPRLLRIDKNRQGETKQIELDWCADRQEFRLVEGGR